MKRKWLSPAQLKGLFRGDFYVPYDPWPYFFIFIAANAFLTYVPLGLLPKLWVLVLGLFLPVFFLASTRSPVKTSKEPIFLQEAFPAPPLWLWIVLAIIALLLRFWGIGAQDRWVEGDGILGVMGSLELLLHWNWGFFRTFAQIPTVIPCFVYLLFKVSDSPFFNLFFPSAFFGFLTVVVAYGAARQFFSRSISLLSAGLWALSYWPIYVSRTPLNTPFFSLWQCSVFYCFGRFLNSTRPGDRKKWAGWLGICSGLGFMTMPAWIVMTFFISLALLVIYFRASSKDRLPSLFYFIFLGLTSLLLLWMVLREGYGRHMGAISFWNDSTSWVEQMKVISGYLSSLFWGTSKGLCLPNDGGFLNLFLGAFFFIGILELYRLGWKPLTLGLVSSFFLFLLPGFLATGVETMRISAVFPILFLITAFGIQSLLLHLPGSRRALFLTAVLIVSPGMDVVRLFQLFRPPDANIQMTKVERQECFEVLRKLSSEQGPGLILTELIPYEKEHSLTYFTFPFNAALNPSLSTENIKWAALFTESHFVPFLSKRFPSSTWMELPSDKPGAKSPHCLGVIPLIPSNGPDLLGWKDFYSLYQQIDFKIMDLSNGVSYQDVLRDLMDIYQKVPKDPFLQSCYFEKLLFCYSWEKTFYPGDRWTNWENFGVLFEQAFRQSYQDEVLCEKFGRLLASEGNFQGARGMFEKALKLDPGNQFLEFEIGQMTSKKQGIN